MWRIDESRSRFRLMARLIVLIWVFAAPHVAGARATPEQHCQRDRSAAAGRYALCQLQANAKYVATFDIAAFNTDAAKCRGKYVATWAHLQRRAMGSGSACDGLRFADRGNGTVTDRLTGLQWEQKTNDGSIHDVGNAYRWSSIEDLDETDPDGSVFTTFVATLNGTCFAGACDWRLPTRDELLTIVSGGYPCPLSPCIDEALFGPTTTVYWTSTESLLLPTGAWAVGFWTGGAADGGSKFSAILARAVRGGL